MMPSIAQQVVLWLKYLMLQEVILPAHMLQTRAPRGVFQGYDDWQKAFRIRAKRSDGRRVYRRPLISIAAFLLAVPALTIEASACQGSTIILDEAFKTPDAGWDAKDDWWSFGAKGATLKMPTSGGYYALNRNYTSDAVDICTSFNWPADLKQDSTHGSGVGVVFWAKDYQNFYAILLQSDGGLHVSRRVANNSRVIVQKEPKDIKVAHSAPGDLNEIDVQISGPHAIIRVNGTQVVETAGQPPPSGGFVGLDAYTTAGNTFAVTFPKFQISANP